MTAVKLLIINAFFTFDDYHGTAHLLMMGLILGMNDLAA